MIYLDNCATTKPRQEVVDVMIQALKEDFANPSSLHSLGFSAEKKVEEARKNVAKLINALPEELYFTSGGTESNNIALHGLINKNKRLGNKIITTKIEHASVIEQLRSYKNQGFEVVEISVDRFGNLNTDELFNEIDDKTIVLSLFHVNNEVGSINDIENIVKKVKSINKNILIHVDGVQAFGKIPVDVKTLGCDTYSMSGHKIYGPKGIGVLYVKNSLKISSLVIGGGQESGLRSGTENVPGILGLGKACEITYKEFDKEYEHAKKIKKYLAKKIEENLSDYEFNNTDYSSPYITSVSFRDVRAEVLLHFLEQDEIYISTASACTSNGTHKSHVLEAIGINEKLSEGTIRICISKDIDEKEVDDFVEALKKYVSEIREIMKR